MKRILILVALVATSFPVIALKYTGNAYVTDRFNNLVHDSFKHCVRTGTWTPEQALAECDDVVSKVETPTTAPAKPAAPSEEGKTAPLTPSVVTPSVVTPSVVTPSVVTPSVVTPRPAPTKDAVVYPQMKPIYFAFNKSILTSESKQSLNEFADKLNKGTYVGRRVYDTVYISGFADLIGKPSYNMLLSNRRAQAVALYLHKQGVKVQLAYRGAGQRAWKEEDCSSKKGTALKTCYRHDRRVEVEVQ
jgi:OOP family OmpA-OmpF porin